MKTEGKKALVVINPVAGKKRAKNAFFDAVSSLSANDYEVSVHMTKGKMDAAEYVAICGSDYDRIVVMGGDGTLSEVITGVMNCGSKPEIGYIPCGTTNDLAKTLGLPTNTKLAADIAASGIPFITDIGKFGQDKYFSYVASFGIFTSSSYDTPQSVKNSFGSLAYLISGLQEFLNSDSAPAYNLKVRYDDGEIEDSFIFGSISNSKSIAGLVKLPDEFVNLCDGVFEVFLIKRPKNPIEFNQLFNSMTGGKFNNPNIIKFRSSELQISCDREIPWTADGEFAGAVTDVEIKDLHGEVTIICPEARREMIEKMKNSPTLPTEIN